MVKYLALFLAFFAFSCSGQPKQRTISSGYYYWKTSFKLSSIEINHLKQLNVSDLFVRFFDVDWDEQSQQALPVAMINWKDTSKITLFNCIPTVFITNRTFSEINNKAGHLEELASNIFNKIKALYPDTQPIREIQIDCDWSVATQLSYFSFLNLLRKKLEPESILLSATIRLHQVKYAEKTGVPPVDRGMLMVYNTGQLADPKTENSILDFSTAQKYFLNFEFYPLKLDIVLPVFSWGVVFRDQKMLKLLNEPVLAALSDTSRFKQMEGNWLKVVQSTYVNGHYLYANDRIRIEESKRETIVQTAKLLAQEIPRYPMRLCWYHLDSTTTIKHASTELQHIQQIFTTP